ncbi:SEC-C metal-binding domain-containing protein [Stenotrophomonas maltophilia]|uniref:SEC-C metal-binding domain-containing protein n=1 Tax=Stenotrophomonas maltophilia TaxID=40324 RepID=UPI0038969407
MDKPTTERLNLRIPQDVKAGLQVYADNLGISLNAAAILAIRNFLPFALKQAQSFEQAMSQAEVPKPRVRETKAQAAMPHRRAEPVLMRKVGRNEGCPCMSGRKAKHCHPEWT